ncbi:MAG: hypothetical protein ACJ76S_11320, partial [Solirubrobacteraceae bacterium]
VTPRARPAAGLALLALVLPLAAGCGGGAGQSTSKGSTTKTKTTARKPGPKAPRGGAVSSFSAKVLSANRAQLTVTLKSPQPLVLRVNKVAGANTTKVGKLQLGRKPAGRSVVAWDLKVGGRKLGAGRYSLVMRAGKAGRSRPVTVSVPG